jgi:HK97 gp10 family phage protein
MATWRSAIPQITRDLPLRAEGATKAGAQRIQDEAKLRSRVRTGRMRDAWKTEQVERHEWEVHNDISYVIYNEYGTRYMSAQPMLGPAVEAESHRQLTVKEIQKAFDHEVPRPR